MLLEPLPLLLNVMCFKKFLGGILCIQQKKYVNKLVYPMKH